MAARPRDRDRYDDALVGPGAILTPLTCVAGAVSRAAANLVDYAFYQIG